MLVLTRRAGEKIIIAMNSNHHCEKTAWEHVAVLQEAGGHDQLRRQDDLLDEGVSAVFGVQAGEADLHALCFDPGRFTAEQARRWLRDRGFEPRLFWAAEG
jgi:hypothetical protein